MKAETKIEATELELIEEALHQLVTVAVSEAGYRRLRPSGPMSMADIHRHMEAKRAMTPAQRAADDLLDAPVGEALRQGLTILGRRLNEIARHDMQDIAERVADRDPSNFHRRVDVIDKRWDGIGDWVA